jgi:GrpB-like predicted nucleotidyltransferase (UPF0157 family)
MTITAYDPRWPGWFTALARVYLRELGALCVDVEHIGSTSVPGLAAKPILDIDLVIHSRSALPDVVARLTRLGYRHEGDLGIAGREAFARHGDDVPRDGTGARQWPAHHLYVCDVDAPALEQHLRFREWLRAHPDDAAAYARLKQRLGHLLRNDREGYTAAKTAFIEHALLETRKGEAFRNHLPQRSDQSI